eukprot:TRINITY_DN11738_c0_g1_i3.p1 TRINITY_DN11738_c0_g1~~TRINITY_DN11738_c0_g1_i3.p1  ORF type:complete len:226 (+),score=42.44 TRINITY_DN11738_c0_g1_i3:363-1040(+)
MWSVILGSCILREEVSKLQVFGILICIIGTTGVAGVFDLIEDSTLTIIWTGVAYALASSVTFSAMLLTHRCLHSVAPGQTPAQRVLWMFMNRLLLGTAFTVIFGDLNQLPATVYQWTLMLLYSGIMMLYVYLVVSASKILPPHILNVLLTLNVFFSLIYQLTIFENSPGTWATVCIFVQAVGVVMAQQQRTGNSASMVVVEFQDSGHVLETQTNNSTNESGSIQL